MTFSRLRLVLAGTAALLTACAVEPPVPRPATPAEIKAQIAQSLPSGVGDRTGWSEDIYAALTALHIDPTREHICAVIAVTAQESGFQVDTVVPGLGKIAWREIDKRAEHAGVPTSIVHKVMQLKSPTGRSYAERIDAARTEKELSDIFEDFTGSLPLGRKLFASWNPIRTRGPMQVNVAFADKFSATKPYPFPVTGSIDDELFTRRGSLYFGTAHLLAYSAPYDRYLYRFADYNAGQYSSRNAAFQRALGVLTSTSVTPDGALIAPDASLDEPGATETAARQLAPQLHLNSAEIHDALAEGRSADFEKTPLYRQVFVLSREATGRPPVPALLPRIDLQGPKITHHLTTEWYAHRVDDRFQRCLAH